MSTINVEITKTFIVTKFLKMLMESSKLGIDYSVHAPQLVASVRTTIQTRKEVFSKIQDVITLIPDKLICGKPFCIFYWVTTLAEGSDVEIGLPVSEKFDSVELEFRTLPKFEAFSINHKRAVEDVGKVYGKLFQYANKFGFPSQEFGREVYHNFDDEDSREIMVQFILHPWNKLLVENMDKVLGAELQQKITEGMEALEIETPLEKKFEWLVGMLKKLEEVTDESQRFDIISGCAHFFPEEMISELHEVFLEALKNGPSMIEAVDQTLEYMKTHKGWGSVPFRKGNVLYTTKNPNNPKAFAEAKTHKEKIKAYCFCPIIRDNLDKDIPVTFCNCGAGWPKQIWEGVLGKSLKVEIVKSLTQGDEECQFAVHLPV